MKRRVITDIALWCMTKHNNERFDLLVKTRLCNGECSITVEGQWRTRCSKEPTLAIQRLSERIADPTLCEGLMAVENRSVGVRQSGKSDCDTGDQQMIHQFSLHGRLLPKINKTNFVCQFMHRLAASFDLFEPIRVVSTEQNEEVFYQRRWQLPAYVLTQRLKDRLQKECLSLKT